MKTSIIRFAIAIALAAAAWFARAEAGAMARSADAHQQVVTLRHADVDPAVDPGLAATVSYWLGRYADVTADTNDAEADAHVLRTVANAAFRESQREMSSSAAAVQRLDGVLQAYASALKASPRDLDAAYNYEYVARLRDQVARAPQGKPLKLAQPPVVAAAGDLPAGPTIHGRPGAPPPEAKMEDLQMLAPMEYGDREAQPEATPGGKRERKG
jgi:hypothetical protein